MCKVENRKNYKHSIDLIKYSEDGLRKRCILCVEEIESNSMQSSGYCTPCWAIYQRLKRNGGLQEYIESFKRKWDNLKDKYKDVKKCNTCFIIKNKTEYYPDKKSSSGLQNKCISCVKEYNLSSKKYEKESNKIKHKEYQDKYKDKWKSINRKRWTEDINYKIKGTIRSRFWIAIKKGIKLKSVSNLLGCSIEEFRLYLEQQFKPEMNWENHGEVWEIDHIIGCCNFDLTILEEQQKCFHYSNQQPLFKTTEIAESFGYLDQTGNRNKQKYEL
jgi:hypothetical protein